MYPSFPHSVHIYILSDLGTGQLEADADFLVFRKNVTQATSYCTKAVTVELVARNRSSKNAWLVH